MERNINGIVCFSSEPNLSLMQPFTPHYERFSAKATLPLQWRLFLTCDWSVSEDACSVQLNRRGIPAAGSLPTWRSCTTMYAVHTQIAVCGNTTRDVDHVMTDFDYLGGSQPHLNVKYPLIECRFPSSHRFEFEGIRTHMQVHVVSGYNNQPVQRSRTLN